MSLTDKVGVGSESGVGVAGGRGDGVSVAGAGSVADDAIGRMGSGGWRVGRTGRATLVGRARGVGVTRAVGCSIMTDRMANGGVGLGAARVGGVAGTGWVGTAVGMAN